MNEIIQDNLNFLKYEDLYSLVLFVLANLRNVPEYKILSELSYILDKKNLLNFLGYFGGMTIKIPPLKDFKLLYKSLLLYELVDIEKIKYEDALKKIKLDGISTTELKDCYNQICNTLENYDFSRKD